MKTLYFIGWDRWERPVYKDENGKLWKDTDPRTWRPAALCSAVNNDFEGEPDFSLNSNIQVKFIPHRKTW